MGIDKKVWPKFLIFPRLISQGFEINKYLLEKQQLIAGQYLFPQIFYTFLPVIENQIKSQKLHSNKLALNEKEYREA